MAYRRKQNISAVKGKSRKGSSKDANESYTASHAPADSTRHTCVVCGSRRFAEDYPISTDTGNPIPVTCSACLENVNSAGQRELTADIGAYQLRSKRKAESTEAENPPKRKKAKKRSRAPPPTTAECRFCTEVKDTTEFPTPTKRVVKASPWRPLPPPQDIPAGCANHLCVRKTNRAGPVCKACIGASLAGSLSYKHAEQIGCPHEKCEASWDAVQYVSRYLSNEDFTTYSEKLFTTFVATNKQIVWCPSSDCAEGGLVDARFSVNRGLPQMECHKCETRLCANCKVAWHKDQTCQEYQLNRDDGKSKEETDSLKSLAKLGARCCPHCAYGVLKIDGCPNMICGSCHLNFYWDTAELVSASNKKAKASTKNKVPEVATPQWYKSQGCEVDITKEREAKLKEAAAAEAVVGSSSSSVKGNV